MTESLKVLDVLADLIAERVDQRPVHKRALTKFEAAQSLSISADHLERFVLPDIRVIRVGRRVLIPIDELDRWVDDQAKYTLPPPR